MSVISRAAGLRKHRIITSHLAIQSQLALDPQNSRMKEENRLDELLRQIGPVVPATKMRQLMKQHELKIFIRSAVIFHVVFDQPCGKYDRWPEEANGSWDPH